MQRPICGYRGGGIRAGSHSSYSHHLTDDNRDLSLSNSSLDDIENNNSTAKSKDSSLLQSTPANNDEIESAIRHLRSLTTQKKKTKTNANISNQKADLPQLNMMIDKTNNLNDQTQNNQSRHWFPKPDIGHVDSTDFIRHNHVELTQSTPPAFLTANPPVGIFTRPTAVIASAGPTRSISAFFSSTSSIKNATSQNTCDYPNSSSLKSTPQPTSKCFIQTASSAFQPIQPQTQFSSDKNIEKTNSIDILKHKSLERGLKLTNVHISHPQSPSIIHIMLHEDFNRACRLLHQMATHPELQTNYIPSYRFKPEINKICACFHEGRWFRCRILQISPDSSSATVVYLDWGMIIPVKIEPKSIRHLPKEFYNDSIYSIQCQLDGIDEANQSISSDRIAQCIRLLSEDEYDIVVTDANKLTGTKIILFNNGKNINEQIKQILQTNENSSFENELIEQFHHELQLSIGDECKAVLSSFSGKDDSFYVLIMNEDSVAIDHAMNALQEDHIPNREYLQIPKVKTLVVARYTIDRKCYRAWVKSVDLDNEEALVFFVDYGNESKVSFADIYICPESVRTLPWLGIRVRLSSEQMTIEELTTFWKLTESHFIWIKINEKYSDCYGIQIKIDLTVYLKQERLKNMMSKQMIDKCVQVKEKTNDLQMNNERKFSLLTPNQNDNENFLGNLFEMINNELRLLRHRINQSDESSQDRHGQLVQLLFSLMNTNNSNTLKKDFK